MIVSHRHRYLFIQVPHTGSTAIARELQEHYDGQPLLWKHAHLDDFLGVATPDERRYFKFLTLRNPLDEAVSIYWKIKSDHAQRITRRAPGVSRRDLGLARYIAANDADFPTYFRRAYNPLLPRDKWDRLFQDEVDFVMRFENLAADFAAVLQRLGIEPVRPLPMVNQTAGREADFTAYYPPEVTGRARAIFGPYMRRVGYRFPAGWDDSVPLAAELRFRALSPLRAFHWKYLKWRDRPAAHAGRAARRSA